MDPTELHVYNHLVSRGYSDIRHEPDGNIPPDFLLDGTIAVEVRRLNQNYLGESRHEGLEQMSNRLAKQINDLLKTAGHVQNEESWYVFYRFKRPIEWKEIKPKFEEALQEFRLDSMRESKTIVLSESIEVDFIRAPRLHDSFFILWGYSDLDSSGLLLEKLKGNIIYCANEKWAKIQRSRGKYSVWWLALVDHIGFSLNDFERELFVNHISIDHEWDKLLIIDRHNTLRCLEI